MNKNFAMFSGVRFVRLSVNKLVKLLNDLSISTDVRGAKVAKYGAFLNASKSGFFFKHLSSLSLTDPDKLAFKVENLKLPVDWEITSLNFFNLLHQYFELQ